METLSVLLAFCEGNPPFTIGFPPQITATRTIDVSFGVSLINLLDNSGVVGDSKRHDAHGTSL